MWLRENPCCTFFQYFKLLRQIANVNGAHSVVVTTVIYHAGNIKVQLWVLINSLLRAFIMGIENGGLTGTSAPYDETGVRRQDCKLRKPMRNVGVESNGINS